MKFCIIFYFVLFSLSVIAEESSENKKGHHGAHMQRAGGNLALQEVQKGKGFRLSDEAFETLDVRTEFKSGPRFELSQKSVVISLNRKGIFTYYDGFFTLHWCTNLKVENTKARIHCPTLNREVNVVVSDVGPLRVADIFSTDDSEYGHGH